MSQENQSNKQRLIRHVNRQQMSWRAVDVERLIGEDHPARAIWALVGQNELDELFTQVLAALSKEGLIPLEQVMQDGTRASCSAMKDATRKRKALRITATKRSGGTAKAARGSHSVARRIRSKAVRWFAAKKVRPCLPFKGRWPAKQRKRSTAAVGEWWNFATHGSRASWACGSFTCGGW